MQNSITDDKRRVFLTIDVEADYARSDSYSILADTAPFFDWLNKEQIPLTAFVTGQIIKNSHPIVEQLQAARIPIGLHGFEHESASLGDMSTSHEGEITRGVEAYQKRLGRMPAGYRAPSGIVSREDILLLERLGLRYDASVFPVQRPGRYDFSLMPRTPFRWEKTSLIEMPCGLLTKSLPAGMTFINLLGASISSKLMRWQTRKRAECSSSVVDIHFHNLFNNSSSMQELPIGLRMVYKAGAMANGFSQLKMLVSKLRTAGVIFGSLEAYALSLNIDSLPEVLLDTFSRML